MPTPYPSRVQAFRDEIIRTTPKVPNMRQAIADLHAQPTRRLILTLLTCRMRLVPIKPRVVRIWCGGVKPCEFEAVKPKLRPFLQKVKIGKDLDPHLFTPRVLCYRMHHHPHAVGISTVF